MGVTLLLLLTQSPVQAADPPNSEIPATVLGELRMLENDFELALSQDCDAARCFSKGCTYVSHSVADRPRAASMPGLGMDLGPGSVVAQEFLTQAQCSFAHEKAEDGADMTVLSRRLQSKLSAGWLNVSVGHQELLPLPPSLRDPPPPPVDEAAEAVVDAPPPAPVDPWVENDALRELWLELLPHLYWMIGLGLFTLASAALIWSWRRVGQPSFEEQALLAQLNQPAPPAAEASAAEGDPAPAAATTASEDEAARLEQQEARWSARLAAFDPAKPDPELQAAIRELLRAGELAVLAKAALRFPNTLPAAFPSGGDIAGPKIALAELLRDADPRTLPTDAELFAALDRYALFAALVTQGDAGVVRSVREDFGTAGLARLVQQLPPRHAAILFALAPLETRHELVGLLTEAQTTALSAELLRSNRLGPDETADLFAALQAAQRGDTLPPLPARAEVADHGAPFDSPGALSTLLPKLPPAARSALFQDAQRALNGSLPAWVQGVLTPDMLLALEPEALADLLLSVEVEALAAWASLLDGDARGRVLGAAPESLRRSIEAVSVFPNRAQQVALADRGRQALARGFQAQLARARRPFASVLAGEAA
jgi:hypothetical protein